MVAVACERDRDHYSFALARWHVVVLNSNCRCLGCTAGSAQLRWLQADLAQHPNVCTLAYMHAPPLQLNRGRQPRRNSEVRHASGFGVLKLVLRAASYEWRFVSDGSSAFADSGAGPCHQPRPRRRRGRRAGPGAEPTAPCVAPRATTSYGAPRSAT
jgi:hypothetical protein